MDHFSVKYFGELLVYLVYLLVPSTAVQIQSIDITTVFRSHFQVVFHIVLVYSLVVEIKCIYWNFVLKSNNLPFVRSFIIFL
jgi:hypothetical protein